MIPRVGGTAGGRREQRLGREGGHARRGLSALRARADFDPVASSAGSFRHATPFLRLIISTVSHGGGLHAGCVMRDVPVAYQGDTAPSGGVTHLCRSICAASPERRSVEWYRDARRTQCEWVSTEMELGQVSLVYGTQRAFQMTSEMHCARKIYANVFAFSQYAPCF